MFDRVLQSQLISLATFATLAVVSLVADVVFLDTRRMLPFRVADHTLEDQIGLLISDTANPTGF